jgi:hypothetical protein
MMSLRGHVQNVFCPSETKLNWGYEAFTSYLGYLMPKLLTRLTCLLNSTKPSEALKDL